MNWPSPSRTMTSVVTRVTPDRNTGGGCALAPPSPPTASIRAAKAAVRNVQPFVLCDGAARRTGFDSMAGV